LGNTLHWVQSSGLGTIYSFTIVHRAPDPAFEIPYCIAIIRLDEDWYMTSNIVGAKMESIAVGCRVRVDFLDVGDVTLPVFTLQVD
jgi:uncharacterized OB-fold protein